jgi:hypothetical protein
VQLDLLVLLVSLVLLAPQAQLAQVQLALPVQLDQVAVL